MQNNDHYAVQGENENQLWSGLSPYQTWFIIIISISIR